MRQIYKLLKKGVGAKTELLSDPLFQPTPAGKRRDVSEHDTGRATIFRMDVCQTAGQTHHTYGPQAYPSLCLVGRTCSV